jgi:hypothetical protein
MLGVAVPCYKYHIPVLKRLFESIEQQTVKPDFVCVSCSSSTEQDIPIYNYSFPITFLIAENRQNAAENRNIAAKKLIEKGCDYISFFDADDVMHKQRIEAIKIAFNTNVKIVLHSYLIGTANEKLEEYKKFDYLLNQLAKAPSGCAYVINDLGKPIHHSQVSVHKSVMDVIQFREDKIYERREDSLFCGDALQYFGNNNLNNCYICNPLSIYFEEGAWY